MSALASLQFFLVAALLFAGLASLCVSLAVPLVQHLTRRAAPEARYRAWLLLALSPALLASGGMLATVAPSLLGVFWPAFDHCPTHPSGHAHLCLVHLPHELGSSVSLLVLGGALGFLAVRAAAALVRLRDAARICSRLLALAKSRPRLSAAVLPTPSPVCLSVGILKPTTVLSEGFLRAVDARQLEAVLAHEAEHARRKDALIRAIASSTAGLMLAAPSRQLFRELDLAAEQSCDEAAARAIGDRLTMAEVILKVERLVGEVPHGLPPLALSFGGSGIPRRVTSLLAPQALPQRMPWARILVAAALFTLVATSEPLHHLTETVVGMLVH